MKKILSLLIVMVLLVGCNDNINNSSQNDENHVDENHENNENNENHENFSENNADQASNNEIDNEWIEFNPDSVELLNEDDYEGDLKEQVNIINRFVTYQNEGNDEALIALVEEGVSLAGAHPDFKIIKVEIDEELSFEREGFHFVEVMFIRLYEKEAVLRDSALNQISERYTSFVFDKRDNGWFLVNI